MHSLSQSVALQDAHESRMPNNNIFHLNRPPPVTTPRCCFSGVQAASIVEKAEKRAAKIEADAQAHADQLEEEASLCF